MAETANPSNGMRVTHLTCEYQPNPLGIDSVQPRLAWRLESPRRGARQTAYRVLVAGDAERLARDEGDLWDSGRVESDRSVHVVYEGAALASRRRAHWKVQAWDADGQATAWSEPAWFEMALLDPGDWTAQWIAGPGGDERPTNRPAPVLRREFDLDRPIRRARAYVCGLGYYELRLNGQKVGDHVLDPGFTRYDRRALYVTHDVTALLRQGANAVGATLGNGIFNQDVADAWDFQRAAWRANPRMLLQLHVEFEDGSTRAIVSDTAWKATEDGPIRHDMTRTGEHYDARREMPGWDQSGFDDAKWQPAVAVAPPKGRLSAQMCPPVRVTRTLEPVALTEPQPGVFVFDLGQNFSGWAQLRVSGPAGVQVQMRYGERLGEDGRVDQKQIKGLVRQGEFQTDRYTLKGEGQEVFEPHFTYHGFQYVEVTGLPERPTLETIRGRVVHTDFASAGTFECSNDLLNRIQRCTLWSYVSNFVSIPTDCPQREKNGWTGDALLAAEAGLFNFDSLGAYEKWMNDFQDEQRPAGDLPGIVPTAGWGYSWGNGPCWDSAYVVIPWYLYLYRGNVGVLERHYENMRRYVDYLTSKSERYQVFMGLGDWVPPYGRAADYTAPATLTSSAYYFYDTVIVSKVAAILGKDAEAKKYAELARNIRKRFNEEFYDPMSGLYAGGSQTALGTALHLGLAEPGQRGKVARQLVAEVRQQKWRLNTGIHGTKFLLNALTEQGHTDVAYRVATQKVFPSWGWWIERGATTLWEDWRGDTSLNHIMYGDISAWCYKALAGINPDPERPGFQHVLVRPQAVGDLEWVRAEYETMYGVVRSAWRRQDGQFVLEVTIPANATATVVLPAEDAGAVTEGDGPAAEAAGVNKVEASNGQVSLSVGSGQYRFACPLA